MEITFAIMVLAGSLVVLLGLQSSVVDRMIRGDERQTAMMYARLILAGLEANDLVTPADSIEGSISDVLDGGFVLDQIDNELLNEAQNYQANLQVEEWSPNLSSFGINVQAENLMYRVRLEVSWSDSPRDRVEVFYFVPVDDD